MKETFVNAEIEVIALGQEDIITTSSTETTWGNPTELPEI